MYGCGEEEVPHAACAIGCFTSRRGVGEDVTKGPWEGGFKGR